MLRQFAIEGWVNVERIFVQQIGNGWDEFGRAIRWSLLGSRAESAGEFGRRR